MPRPKLNPTDEDRRLVKSMAAVGTRQEDIARMVHIRSPKTEMFLALYVCFTGFSLRV